MLTGRKPDQLDTYDGNQKAENFKCLGVWLNHSSHDANCKVVSIKDSMGQPHLVVVAVKDIPLKGQLLHNYNDKRPGVPAFLYK
jgi:hypothetical protein